MWSLLRYAGTASKSVGCAASAEPPALRRGLRRAQSSRVAPGASATTAQPRIRLAPPHAAEPFTLTVNVQRHQLSVEERLQEPGGGERVELLLLPLPRQFFAGALAVDE